MSAENWRIAEGAEDYFSQQNKKLTVADRRPVIRRASDLVGPGIDRQALRIEDWNDPRATNNGYFSSLRSAAHGPTLPASSAGLVGYVTSDAEIGGVQELTDVSTGVRYRRTFTRRPGYEERVDWTPWLGVGPGLWRSNAGSMGTQTTYTPGTSGDLNLPQGASLGIFGTFDRASDTTLAVLRQGIYQGNAVVQFSNWNWTMDGGVRVWLPNGTSTSVQMYTAERVSAAAVGTVTLPFAFFTSAGGGQIKFTAYITSSGSNAAIPVKIIHLTVSRLGDFIP